MLGGVPRRFLVTLLASFIGLAVGATGADAASVTLSPNSQTARAGASVELRATAPAGSSCRLSVGDQRAQITAPTTGKFVISGRVSRRARPRAHTLSLRCAEAQTRTRLKVKRTAANRNARGRLFRGSLHISPVRAAPQDADVATNAPSGPQSTAAFPRSILSASSDAQNWWARNADAITTSFRNGQCTDWTQQRRPDIVQSAYMRRYDRVGPGEVVTSWNAMYWTELATKAGLAIGRSPVVGAIMVYQPGSYGAGTAGHVAVVESVAPDRSFVVSQMNSPYPNTVTWQRYSAEAASTMVNAPGIAFIL